ncbi:DUF937 domain-containing protein [Lysobacter pythonis]|uniref:DUF937 domain-containing protein n=2 Tax=Solilutibacter pythonis TaxID=2483112 RepID=A0A3M2HDV6_9GAMM|nr:DUF937 domain-containing protein [Lysobacter pythonis]
MTTLTDDLLSQLSGAPMQQMAQRLGLAPQQMAGAAAAALPLLMGALGKQASQPQGAEALLGALGRDHAGGGGIGDLLGAVLGGGGGRQADGAGILGHIFGARESQAAQGLGQATGIGGDKAQMLLKILAPIVMAYLAKRMFGGGQAQAAAPSAGALDEVLGRETRAVRQQGGIGGGLLGAVLDQDGDGQFGLSDVLKMGGSILGGKR